MKPAGLESPQKSAFVTTHWSVVLTAGGSDTTRAQDALARLCQTYWFPLYTYVRRRGHSPEDAKDLTQEFFARLLEEVLKRLQTEYDQEGKTDLFTALNPCLVGERTSQPYAELAQKLGVSEGTVKSAVHRLRQRYRQLLREEIAQTVAEPGEVDEELRHLFAVLAGA
jgi:hypothetical protein